MKRVVGVLLMVFLLLSLSNGVWAETDGWKHHGDGKGSISTKVVFPVGQSLETLESSDISVALINEKNEVVETIDIDGSWTQDGVTLYNEQGVAIASESELAYSAEIQFTRQPLGKYFVRYSGNGYRTHQSNEVVLESANQMVVTNAFGQGFSRSDLNADGKIDQADLSSMLTALTETNLSYDMNQDGILDIYDLAYVQRSVDLESLDEILNTSLITDDTIDLDNMTVKNGNGDDLVISGDLDSMLTGDAGDITITSNGEITETNPVVITIPMKKEDGVEMSQIQLDIPSGTSMSGTAMVEVVDEAGNVSTMIIPFNQEPLAVADGSMDVLAIADANERETVVINLGKKVVVKKVTIKVSQVTNKDGGKDYVAVQKVEFIQDIVPDNINLEQGKVRSIDVKAGSEEVTLSWERVPNVTGYKVYYSDKPQATLSGYTLGATVTGYEATIGNLENLKTYYFVVVSTQDGWTSVMSDVHSAMPMPDQVPGKMDGVRFAPGSENLTLVLAYQPSENAVGYNIYWREKGVGNFEKVTTSSTSHTFSRLKDGVTYEAKVAAYNGLGEGPISSVVTAKAEIIEIIPELPEHNKIDLEGKVSNIRLLDPNRVADTSTFSEGGKFDPKVLIDGEYNTQWTAKGYNGNTDGAEVTFKDAIEMNYFIWVPRLDGNYSGTMGWHPWAWGDPHYAGQYTLKVTNDKGEETVYRNYQGRILEPVSNTYYYVYAFPVTNVTKISVTNTIYNGAPHMVSLSELIFYEYDSIYEDVANLFANESYTALKPEVNQAKIDELMARTTALKEDNKHFPEIQLLVDELELAGQLVSGESKHHVMNGIPNTKGLIPTGYVAKSGDMVYVYADIPEGEQVTLTSARHFGEVSSWKGGSTTLHNGLNKIKTPVYQSGVSNQGGIYYLNYSGNKGNEVVLHFVNHAESTNQRSYPILELENWDEITENQRKDVIRTYIQDVQKYDGYNTMAGNNFLNTTEISTPDVLLTMPIRESWAGISSGLNGDENAMVDRVYENILTWEEFIYLMNTTYGIPEAEMGNLTRQNIRQMQMFAGAFMYAAGSHVGIGTGSCAPLMQGVRVSQGGDDYYGWGISHEIGHNYDRMGYAEITNNIYSQFAMTWDNDKQTGATRVPYQDVFTKVALGYEGKSNSVFVELGKYWQLHLAFDDVMTKQEDNFYFNFNKKWAEGAYGNYGKDDRIALISAEIAGVDLSEYYQAWGTILSDEVITKLQTYPQDERALYYLNDESRALRLTEGYEDLTAVSGLTSNLSVDENYNMTISWSGLSEEEIGKLQGFEILRNGKSIGFAMAADGNYVDLASTANNLAYEYALVPVTKLGMRLETHNVGEEKVAYDVVINEELWDGVVQEDGSILINFTETVSTAGVRLSGDQDWQALFGNEVEVLYNASETETPDYQRIEAVDFSSNDATTADKFIAYFNKPGAEASDKRIWTYDVNSILIRGVTAGQETAFVETLDFIQYPGDDISLYAPSMGILKHDYIYGEGEENMIKAGSIVMVGNYRGDPVYNTIQMEGRFVERNAESVDSSKIVERAINGVALLFAEIPEDGQVSETSDGFFIFVPDVQAEADLHHGEEHDHESCTVDSLLPTDIRGVLMRSDVPSEPATRTVSTTAWTPTASYDSLPYIELTAE